jgi:ATP-dependent DNA helicase DinG
MNVEDFFADGGPLSAVLGGYRKRDEQVRMAKAVEGTLKGGGALLADGPTGTGKSMSYLSAIALGMREGDSSAGEEVEGKAVISTATKALQHQLVGKDLPTLARACNAANIYSPTFALLKGRGEFLCDRRMDEYLEEQGMIQDPDLVQIDLWRRGTNTGDKETLPITAPRYWPEIAADADDCVRKGCDYEHSCFYYRQKEAAQGADILVVNHALLLANFASGGAVFSMADKHLIVDEAHRLEEYVCEAFGSRVSRHRVRYVLGAVRRKAHDLDDYLETAQAATDDFFGELRSNAYRTLGSPISAPPSYTVLVDELTTIRNLVENNPAEAVNKLTNMVDRLLADLRSFYEPLLGSHAYAVLDPRGARGRGYPTLQSWLVEPAEVVPEHLLEREEDAATVMTSATLATGRSFDYQRRRLGFDVTHGLRVREHLGAEMFDYATNALVYLEEELPPPVPSRMDEFLRGAVWRAAELVLASRGRALLLLATWRAVERFKEEFSVPYPVRYQGEASTSALISWLRDTPNAVLVGTRTLWEGVDVAGDALSLCVVDKVPFPPPNDPVIEKLCQKAGSGWFMEVSLPKALLAIRQGLGRLIRRHSDRGVMAILDSRVTSSRWAPVIRRAIPKGAPITHDVLDVEEFFSRGPREDRVA